MILRTPSIHAIGGYLVSHRKNFYFKVLQNLNNASGHILLRRPTKVRATIDNWKVMMIVAFHQNRVFGYRILPKNTNVDFQEYIDFLSQVILPEVNNRRIRRPIILHNNARPHKYQKVKDFFARHRWEELKHPPYSPDLNPCDYDGIARIKRPNKGKRFANELDLRKAYDQVISEINLKNAATGIQHLPLRWALVNQSGGEYIH